MPLISRVCIGPLFSKNYLRGGGGGTVGKRDGGEGIMSSYIFDISMTRDSYSRIITWNELFLHENCVHSMVDAPASRSKCPGSISDRDRLFMFLSKIVPLS